MTRQASYDVSDPTRASVTARRPGRGATARARRPSPSATWAAGGSAGSPSWPTGPTSPGTARAPVNAIDRHVFAKLKALKINPSEPSSDAVFLRRAYLDAIGRLPEPGEARAFLADPDPEKRAELVDRLVDRPEFADFWALKWADLLRNEEKTMGDKGVWVFQRWLRDQIARDVPLDEFARRLVTGQGSTWTEPPASFYRTNRDPMTAAETIGQVFLGVRLQCARCHNHPFDVWTQDDYYGLAAFFGNVRRKEVNNLRRDSLDTHEINGDEIVYLVGPPRDGPAPDGRDDGAQAPARPQAPPRRRPRRARRPGRLADPRQPPVRPQPGQPRLVPPDGPRGRRAGRRLPRLEPAVQPRAARRPDGRARPRTGCGSGRWWRSS